MRQASLIGTRKTSDPEIVDEMIAETTRRCAHDMLLRAGDVSAQISAQVLAHVAGLLPSASAQAVTALRESTEENVGAIFATLALGFPRTRPNRRLEHKSYCTIRWLKVVTSPPC